MSIHRIALAAILACAPAAFAAEPEKPDRPVRIDPSKIKELLVKRGTATATTRPATPTTRPAKLATVADDAKPVLEQMAAACKQLKCLELAGTLSLIVEDDEQKKEQQTSFTSSFLAPNQFRHQADNQPLIVSTGKKAYGYSPRRKLYTVADAPADRAMLSKYSADINRILPQQNLALVLAISSDPVTELREAAEEIVKAPDQKIGDAAHPALRMNMADKTTMTLLLDPKTHLLRRLLIDYTPLMHKQGRPDVKSALYTLDYTTMKVDAEVAKDAFAWAPPSGARDIVSAAAGDDDEDAGGGTASPLVGKPAPDFTLQDLEGNNVTLSELKGNVILLDFWATWCGPCVMAMPHIDKLHQDYKDRAVKVYAVNQREAREKIEPFLKSKKLSLPVLLDPNGDVGKAYGVRGIPTTVLIGKDGTILKVMVGFDPNADEAIKQIIEEQLKGA